MRRILCRILCRTESGTRQRDVCPEDLSWSSTRSAPRRREHSPTAVACEVSQSADAVPRRLLARASASTARRSPHRCHARPAYHEMPANFPVKDNRRLGVEVWGVAVAPNLVAHKRSACPPQHAVPVALTASGRQRRAALFDCRGKAGLRGAALPRSSSNFSR